MTATVVTALTDQQKEFLRQCEEDFSDRFTESDKEYVEVRDRNQSLPPIEDPWNRHNKDGFRGGGGRRFRDNRNQDYDRGGRDNRDRDRNWDRDRGDRDRDRDRDGWNSRHSFSHRNQRYRPYETSKPRD